MENTLFEIIDFSDTRVIIKVTALNALDVAFHPFLDSKMAYISVQRGARQPSQLLIMMVMSQLDLPSRLMIVMLNPLNAN